MATAFIRIKVELPDEQAARFVHDRHVDGWDRPPRAKEIADDITGSVIDHMQDSDLVARYGATITHHPR